MTLPNRAIVSRSCAIALLLVLLFALWVGVISPIWSGWSGRAEAGDRAAELLIRLQHTANEAPALQQELTRMGQNQRDDSVILIAANANLAGATLQSEIKRMAAAIGAQVRSFQQLPPVQEDLLNRIGVRVDMQSNPEQMSRLLYDIKAHKPILLVRHLTIRSQEQQNQPIQQQPQLSVQLEIIAFTSVQQ